MARNVRDRVVCARRPRSPGPVHRAGGRRRLDAGLSPGRSTASLALVQQLLDEARASGEGRPLPDQITEQIEPGRVDEGHGAEIQAEGVGRDAQLLAGAAQLGDPGAQELPSGLRVGIAWPLPSSTGAILSMTGPPRMIRPTTSLWDIRTACAEPAIREKLGRKSRPMSNLRRRARSGGGYLLHSPGVRGHEMSWGATRDRGRSARCRVSSGGCGGYWDGGRGSRRRRAARR
jgi:hypothetical protein